MVRENTAAGEEVSSPGAGSVLRAREKTMHHNLMHSSDCCKVRSQNINHNIARSIDGASDVTLAPWDEFPCFGTENEHRDKISLR